MIIILMSYKGNHPELIITNVGATSNSGIIDSIFNHFFFKQKYKA